MSENKVIRLDDAIAARSRLFIERAFRLAMDIDPERGAAICERIFGKLVDGQSDAER